MKVVMLIDSENGDFDDIVDSVSKKNPVVINTNSCNEAVEYRYLQTNIEYFSKHSKNDILLAKFSGKEDIARELGDKLAEMIVTVSYNKDSRFYTEFPRETITNLVNIFNN